MSSLMIYMFLVMDGVIVFFIVLTLILAILSTILVIYSICEDKTFQKKFWIPIIGCIFCFIATVLVPNTKQTAIIFGVPYFIDKAEEIHLDKVPVKVVDYLNAYLDQKIDKLVSKKNQPQK